MFKVSAHILYEILLSRVENIEIAISVVVCYVQNLLFSLQNAHTYIFNSNEISKCEII